MDTFYFVHDWQGVIWITEIKLLYNLVNFDEVQLRDNMPIAIKQSNYYTQEDYHDRDIALVMKNKLQISAAFFQSASFYQLHLPPSEISVVQKIYSSWNEWPPLFLFK